MFYCIVTADQSEIDEGSLDGFLNSLDGQLAKVILVLRAVDYSELDRYARHPFVSEVLLSPAAGLSKVRNLALRHLAEMDLADDDIVSFPDDDCRYTEKLVQLVEVKMESESLDLLVGRYGEQPLTETTSRRLTFGDALLRSSSVCLFVKWRVLRLAGGFNEALGVGSGNFNFGEDNDFAIRALALSSKAGIDTQVHVWHLEMRTTVGRNPKGYLVAILANPRYLQLWPYFVRGILGTIARSLAKPSTFKSECRNLGAVLSPPKIRRVRTKI